MFQMHALRKGTPADRQSWTVLDADAAFQYNIVPGGDGGDNRVRFGFGHADSPCEEASFRSSVGGDVQ